MWAQSISGFLRPLTNSHPWKLACWTQSHGGLVKRWFFTFQCFWVIFRHTIPATNNLPLDVGRAPKGKSSCNHWFSVATCSFQGGYSHLHWRSTSLPTRHDKASFQLEKSQLLLGGSIQNGFSRHSWKISSSKNWKNHWILFHSYYLLIDEKSCFTCLKKDVLFSNLRDTLPGKPHRSSGIFIQPKAPGMKPRAARGTISMSFVSPLRFWGGQQNWHHTLGMAPSQ